MIETLEPACAPDDGRLGGAPATLVPAVVRALALLERVARQRQPMSASQLAAELALPRSSVHGLCHTLLHHGYLRRQGDGGFAIGASVMGLAEAFIADIDVAREFAGLWQEAGVATDEAVILSVLNGIDSIYVAVRNSPRPLGVAFNVGVRIPAHLSGSGKAMLAFQPRDTLQRLFDGVHLATFTGRGPASPEALFDELALIRERGYSVDDEGVRAGVLAFGAPVFDAAGRAVAGVAMCINKATLDEDALGRHRDALLDIARRLTRRLGGTAAGGVARAARPT